jgi:hypothetical protein
MAWRALRLEPARVLVPAVVVFGLAAAEETLLVDFADHESLWPVGVFVVIVQALAALGLTFYAGLLDRLVGSVELGLAPPPLALVIGTLPYLRLIVADLVVLVVVAVGTAVLVVPGLVLFTLLVIVGPVIIREDRGVWEAITRSVRLVRPHFLLALFMLTVPLLIERELLDLLEVVIGHESVWQLFAAHFAVGMVFGVGIGLFEVALAERLVAASPPLTP